VGVLVGILVGVINGVVARVGVGVGVRVGVGVGVLVGVLVGVINGVVARVGVGVGVLVGVIGGVTFEAIVMVAGAAPVKTLAVSPTAAILVPAAVICAVPLVANTLNVAVAMVPVPFLGVSVPDPKIILACDDVTDPAVMTSGKYPAEAMETGFNFVPSTLSTNSAAVTELVPVFMLTLTENVEPVAAAFVAGEKDRDVAAAARERIS
jgi:hypothetical protein